MTLKQDTSDDYWFDDDAAEDAAQFFPLMLRHVKGAIARQDGGFRLEPWQDELVRTIFGWKHRGSNLRKYRTVYVEVPRKNGKTTMAAGLLLYMLLVDKEPGREIYSAASTREQAGLVYEIAEQMVLANPILSSRVKCLKSRKRMVLSDGYYQACSSEGGAIHGTSPHCVVFDELHLQKDKVLWEAFHTGLGARDQPLTVAITTAGHDRSTVCWEQHQYAKGVANGYIIDPTFLPVLFCAEADDDWTDEKIWHKANPCLGVALKLDYLRREFKTAVEIPSQENSFRRLHLNQWTEQETRIIPMAQWDDCQQDYTAESYHGRACYAGLDLSSTRDVTAFVLVFPEDDGGCSVLPHFWIPEQNIDTRTGQDQRLVRNFASQGHVEMTDGNEVDVLYLADRIYEICQDYDVQYIGFDPWNAAGVTQLVKERGIPDHVLVKMSQTFGTYNEPFKKLLSWLGNGKFRHNGNHVLRWMAGNVAHKEDPSGNIRPDKGKSADKIDGIAATLMGIALQIQFGNDTSIYSNAGSGVVLI